MPEIINNKIINHNIIELYVINQHHKSHRGSVDPGTPPETSKIAKLEEPAAGEDKEDRRRRRRRKTRGWRSDHPSSISSRSQIELE